MSIKRSISSITALAAIGMASIADAVTPTITGVTAQQRYPWNGMVDISYTVTGDIAEEAKQQAVLTSLKVSAIDMVANTTNTATQLSGDLSLDEGTHAIVWDINAEGLTFKSCNMVFNVACETTPATYCVIDMSGGANATSYPVTYLAEPSSGGFNVDEYKTTKLVLKRLEAGTYKMQGSSNVTLTKPFFCGLFEVTQRQYELVTGANPCSSTSYGNGNSYPVHFVSYDMVRGSSNGAKWPSSSAVDSYSFMGKLQARTGLDFDLPTEAQWEYACRAGTTTTYSYGNSANGNYMWYTSNSSGKSHPVGTKTANAWGLYDMHGNVWEWCLDWYGTLAYGIDPKGSSSGSDRILRGGTWNSSAGNCTSSFRGTSAPSSASANGRFGFRLVRTLSNAEQSAIVLCNGESASVEIDLSDEPLVGNVLWDASWVGGDASATVVITDDDAEIKRTTGAGAFALPGGIGRHELTYTTYIDGVAQDNVYSVTVHKDWKYSVEDGGAVISETTQRCGAISIPATIDGYPVTGIARRLFAGCTNLTSITIPGSVWRIDEDAFVDCVGLRRVEAPGGLRWIIEASNVFGDCPEDLEIVYSSSDVRNVTANQRYPGNGIVDISYEVVGDVTAGLPSGKAPFLLVTATNLTDGAYYEASPAALSGDTGTAEGVHHVSWDMSAQGIEFDPGDVVFTVSYIPLPLYCVIDLSAGASAASYPVSYLPDVPAGGWTDEYKTSKLVMRRIAEGAFKMNGTYDVVLTKPFYCGVFEVTQKQYEFVMGTNPSSFSGDKRPVEKVSYNMIRGASDGARWPASSVVDSSSFMGKLRARTGLDFDLPTEAQWEYACRAGTTTTYSYGNAADGNYMWYGSNSSSATHDVGLKKPNSWGLYDMYGNVWEWCLDWYNVNLSNNVSDPKGASSATGRVVRGGSYYNETSYCTSSYRSDHNRTPSYEGTTYGFRLARTLSGRDYELNSEEYVWAKQSGIVLCGGESASMEIDTRPVLRKIRNSTWVYCRGTEDGIEIVRSEIGQIDSALNIPATIDNRDVVAIGQNAFADCGEIGMVTIPASVSKIGRCAFAGCSNLTQTTISGGIGTLTIGDTAFDAASTVEIEPMEGLYFGGWTNANGVIISDPFHSPTPVTVSPRWMNEGEEYAEHLIFFEDFERDTMEFELTTVGTFPNPASIHDGLGVDGSRGFGFGRSSATGSAHLNCVNTLAASFYARYFITRVEFDEMERYGNWGSCGSIIVNRLGDEQVEKNDFCKVPENDKVADKEYRHRSIEIGMMATNISFQVSDITDASEEFIDNVKIYGRLARKYTVAFDANGGLGEMDTQAVIEGDVLTLASNRFARAGYAFQGWSTVVDGIVAYADGASILDLPTEISRLTFYAAWKPSAPEIVPTKDTIFVLASETIVLSHDADDTMILYTTDGSDPAVNGREYKGAFAVYKACTIRAVAYGAGRYSDEVSIMLTRADNLGEAANLYGYAMETDAVAPWTVDAAVSHDGVSSVRSGAISNKSTTYLMASVKKAGTVSFWWKAQCEEPDEEDGEDGYYDYGAFLVDDVVKARIAGNDTGWQSVSVEVPTGGKHILRWEYRKDGATSYAPDCVWVDQVQWIPADGSGYTLTSPEPVPYSWLRQYNLGVASGDFEAAANAASGKLNCGRPTEVWEEYVAGLDPTNANSQLKAKIEMRGKSPIVTWEPDLNEDGATRRLYKVYGRETLENGGEWQYPTNSLHRFFKVTVEMP